jgi:H+-transporting ATPase
MAKMTGDKARDSGPGIVLKNAENKDESFVPSTGLTQAQAAQLFAKYGPNALPEKSTPKWLIFLEQLWAPMPIMIWIAAITEASIENWPDMTILLAIQFINAGLGYYEITKAGDAVAALKNSLKPEATIKRDGKWSKVDANIVVPGDLCLLGAGSAVPADCLVNEGRVEVDQSAMTGESLPVTCYTGDSVKMGSMVVRGEVEGTVQHTGADTFFGKTATMLQGDSEIGNLQKVLLRIMMILVVWSFLLSGIVFAFLLGSGADVVDSISFTVVLIVASIPIAIEIVCTTTLALGSKELTKHGAIVTRLAAIEDMAGMNMLCSDKTGTLTKNKMEIQDETPIYLPGETQYTALRYAAMATKWNEPARDALDTMTHNAADLKTLDEGDLAVDQLDYMPFDPTIKRTEGTVKVKKTGHTFKTTKGAPHILLALCGDNEELKATVEADVKSFGMRGIRCLAIAKTKGNDDKWQMVGLLTFTDPPREDTKETIHRSIGFGVEVKMITGDHLLIAVETSRVLGLGERIPGRDGVVPLIRDADGLPMLDPETKKAPPRIKEEFGDYIRNGNGFAQVFPEHKFLIVQVLKELGFRVGMTGDGVNDAPALHNADVGIAVMGATDAARAAADIVLTKEGLTAIVEGILISRCIFQRMKNFITYRISATLQLLVFFFIAVLSMQPVDFQPDDVLDTEGREWPAFFRMPVLMLMLITLLNDGTLISIGYDDVKPSETPNRWNLSVLFTVSSVLAGVALISSIILLYMCLDSWNDGSAFQVLGIGGMNYGQVSTAIYLKVSISDFLTLFSARTHDGFFWSTRPSKILMVCAAIALFISTMLACFWPKGIVDGQHVEGLALGNNKALAVWVWFYCLLWWVVQDAAKVVTYKFLSQFNVFGINDVMDKDLMRNESDSSLTNPLLGDLAEKGRGSVEGRGSRSSRSSK